ncbi:helix-turn-helix domain-containing protein [Actinoallomurus purpureus]|uniref:helix-turn-helix domain-containing protein n=1 Tax=Actinoallomurus purpureus TaxID=478114 RepID=UPI002092E2B5|nr:helix-turn-helix transcriptional regulator [Actinoallomurus purpureus]MCO6007366.1 helix-turn-helix domain-containing protein [Actinoallomurus purpureus]
MPDVNATRDAHEGIGRRIARKRRARGLTQQGLAARAYVSRSLIQQVETGRKPATPSLVAAVASALHADPSEIYGQPYGNVAGRADRIHDSIDEMRRALACADVPPDLDVPPRSLTKLAAEVAKVRRLAQDAQHLQVGDRISALLTELSIHVNETGDPRAWTLLNNTQAIAVSLARRLGYNDLANFGLDRAAAAAARSDDANLPRLAQLSRALLLMTIGAWDSGMRLVQRAGDGMDLDSAESRAVYGALQLRAAVLSARAGTAGDAWEYYGLATEAARQLPERAPDFYGLQFHPLNVEIHGVAVAVELTDFDEAIRRDSRLSLPSSVSAERRAHHEIDVGRALVSTGQWDQALRRLLNAETIAPQMTRYHPMARESVVRLIDHHRTLPEALRLLQDRMSLA